MNRSKLLILTTLILSTFVELPNHLKAQSLNFPKESLHLLASQINLKNIAQNLADNYLKKIPANKIDGKLTPKEAQQIQREFVNILKPELGKIVGYKAALTNPKAQEQFQVNEPLSGMLLEKMLLPSDTVLPSNFATIPRLEGDLIVRVKSSEINKAKTPEEALQYLDAVIPFLELPDLVYDENIKPNANELIAINAGARLGIMGEPILINSSENWQTKINQIKVIIRDQNNQELAQGNSSNLLGNPLNVVLWLKNNLNEQGIYLKKGDLLSLGTITPMIPIKLGTNIKAEYIGLTESSVEISVKFY